MADKLSLYNEALRIIGERKLAAGVGLNEVRKARFDLDTVWDAGGVKACLEVGQWNFATRTSMLDYSPSIEPEFGLRRAFVKPEDWVKTTALCSDEFFNCDLVNFKDEAGYWWADIDIIYVSYISDGVTYGLDFAKWPQSFFDFCALHFADKIAMSVCKDKELVERTHALANEARVAAKGFDAQNGPADIQPLGSWARARLGSSTRGLERGSNSGNLIG